jgi:hypothetical protein
MDTAKRGPVGAGCDTAGVEVVDAVVVVVVVVVPLDVLVETRVLE